MFLITSDLEANKRRLKYEANNAVVLVKINVTQINVSVSRKYILEQFAQEEETTFLQSFVQSIDTLQLKMQSNVQDAEYSTLGSHTILCKCRVLWVVKLYSAIAQYLLSVMLL